MNSNIRRAALAVFAMHREDQAWILDRLGVDARKRLMPLLLEIEQLGLSHELIDLQELMRAEGREASVQGFSALETAAPEQLERLQAKYGAELLTILAARGDSRWKNAVEAVGKRPEGTAQWAERLTPKTLEAVVAIARDELTSPDAGY